MGKRLFSFFVVLFIFTLSLEAYSESESTLSSPPSFYKRRFFGPEVSPTLPERQGTLRDWAWKFALSFFQSSPRSQGIPYWMTGYQGEDYRRLFLSLFEALPTASRQSRSSFTEDSLNRVFQEDWENLPSDSFWSESRYQDWQREINEDPEAFLGGVGKERNFFNSQTMRHFFREYAAIEKCIQDQELDPSSETQCFTNPFPSDSVVTKAEWQLESDGVNVYRTDAQSLNETLGSPDAEWKPSEVSHGRANGALRIRIGDRTYVLVGLHIMSKALPDWLWITLWWSPKDTDLDFGSDRPPEWKESLPEMSSYKMCAVSGFEEDALNLDEERADPTLKDALRIVRERIPSHQSWCSNPYMEKKKGNARTNCIGCHQHAGESDSLSPEKIVASLDEGRTRKLEHSPADYLWSFTPLSENLGEETRALIRSATPR